MNKTIASKDFAPYTVGYRPVTESDVASATRGLGLAKYSEEKLERMALRKLHKDAAFAAGVVHVACIREHHFKTGMALPLSQFVTLGPDLRLFY